MPVKIIEIIIDSNHYLYLHPSDTPRLSLVSVQLTGSDNCSIWNKGMLVALLAKNKFGFINGTCKREVLDPSLHNLWDRCNAFVFVWIMNVVSRDSLNIIMYSTMAFLVWKDLNERFNKVTGSRIFQLHREKAFTTQGLDSITIYFGKLKLVWDEFSLIWYLPSCNCEEFKSHIPHQHNIKQFQFLMGLNEYYSNVRSNLLMRVPLPTLNETYYVIVQEESQRGISGIITSSNNTWTTSSETASYLSESQRRPNTCAEVPQRFWICSHWHKKGHNKD